VKSDGDERVFLVRMWVQGGGDDRAGREWRGSVREVDTGQLYYVTGTRDVADFIASRLADRPGSVP
jgi:hypothetical protein